MSRFTEYSQPFLSWWSKNLYNSLPNSLQKWVYIEHPRLILNQVSSNEIEVIWQYASEYTPRGSFLLNDEMKLELSYFIPKKFKKWKYSIDLRLPSSQVLFLQKRYPETVKDNLSQAIYYQIDQLTPFAAEMVYFDVQISQYDHKEKTIIADIFITSCEKVEALLAELQHKGIDKVDIISVADTKQPVHLSGGIKNDKDLCPKISRKPFYFIAAALLILLLTPIILQFYLLYQAEYDIQIFKKNSAEQLEVQDKLYEAQQGLLFLKQKRSELPMALDVIEILSKQLPANTWLKRLSIKNNHLEIRGESENPLILIDLLEDSDSFFDASFDSPVSLNKQSNRQKFHIKAILEKMSD